MFDTLDTRGKTSAQLKGITKSFLETFGDYPLDVVKDAFAKYLRTAELFPKPYNIENLITSTEKAGVTEDGVMHIDKETLNRKADFYAE